MQFRFKCMPIKLWFWNVMAGPWFDRGLLAVLSGLLSYLTRRKWPLEKIEYLDILKDMPDYGATICSFKCSFESSFEQAHQTDYNYFLEVVCIAVKLWV